MKYFLILLIGGILLTFSCKKEEFGCKDSKALNYNFNENVTHDEKLCVFSNENIPMKIITAINNNEFGENYSWEITENIIWENVNSEIDYLVKGEVVIKENAILTIKAGVNIIFEQEAGFIVEEGGMLKMEGTLSEPIILKSIDSTILWRGIHVGGSLDLENVKIEKASVKDYNGWDKASVYIGYGNQGGSGIIKLKNVHISESMEDSGYGVAISRFSDHIFDFDSLVIEKCYQSLYSDQIRIVNQFKEISLINNNRNIFELGPFIENSATMTSPSNYFEYVDVNQLIFDSDYPIFYNNYEVALSNLNINEGVEIFIPRDKYLTLHGNINIIGSQNNMIKIKPWPYDNTTNDISFRGIRIPSENWGDGTAYSTSFNYVDIMGVNSNCIEIGSNYDRGNVNITNCILRGIPSEYTKGIVYSYFSTQLDSTNTQFIDCDINISQY